MRWLLMPFLAISLSIGPPAEAQFASPEIWFTPLGRGDATNMWSPGAPWQNAANRVKVLVLVHHTISPAVIPELIQIRDFAMQHHMQIDLSTEAVAKTATCGAEEGYTWPGENGGAAKLLFDLGFKVDWVDMDGPINSGSYDTGPQGCQLSIPDLITRVASTLKDVVALYPNVKLMDVEPLPGLQQRPTWRADVDAFHLGLKRQLGVPVVAMQADVNWGDRTWQSAMLDLHAYLHEKNKLLSVIYNQSGLSMNDADAVQSTVNNFESLEGALHVIPDKVTFETWSPYPANNMPETSPTTQTWLINRYPRPLSSLNVQFVGLGVHGKLTTMDGKPIANATIRGFKPGVDFTQPLPTTVLQGTVPSTARQALLILRINAECGCNGRNHLLIGTLGYRETAGGAASFNFSWPKNFQQYGQTLVDGQLVGGTIVSEVYAPAGQVFVPNSNAFPVTAGAQFTFTVPAATIGGFGWYGYAAIIWIGASGGEVRRDMVTPPPGKALMSTATTAADGTFALNPLPRGVDGSAPVTVEFDGMNGTYRSTVWTPLQ